MLGSSSVDLKKKWSLYNSRQKESILKEFRRRFPEEYYCQETFFRFLQTKLAEREEQGGRQDTA